MLDTYKPIIGIVGRPDKSNEDDKLICVDERYRKAIIKKGGIPFLILPPQNLIYEDSRPRDTVRLNDTEKKDLVRIINMCDGILMPGGYKWYEYDEFICTYAIDNDIPLLGMCMGMQIMGKVDNVKNNITLDTTIKNDTFINHHQKGVNYVHKVTISDGSMLKKVIGVDTIEVNSRHNYHIDKANLFKVAAYSEDGIIEAIEIPSKRFVLGVQWHPENMMEYDEKMGNIFDEFIDKAKQTKSLGNSSKR